MYGEIGVLFQPGPCCKQSVLAFVFPYDITVLGSTHSYPTKRQAPCGHQGVKIRGEPSLNVVLWCWLWLQLPYGLPNQSAVLLRYLIILECLRLLSQEIKPSFTDYTELQMSVS